MPLSIHGTNGITFNDGSTQNTRPAVGFRNRIINGDMRIDQRNAGASVTLGSVGTGQYLLDRWQAYTTAASKISVQQNAGSIASPSGYSNYLGATSLAATTVSTSDYFVISQKIEGYNISDLAFGTASAQSVTISFWVRSSLTGTFGGALTNNGQTRSYPFTYTISSANTWEKKTITISGDTSGTWSADSGIGIWIVFSYGVGSSYRNTSGSWYSSGLLGATGETQVVATNGATHYITGVQLEEGSTATEFERRPIGTELALCQRYFAKTFPSGTAIGQNKGTSGALSIASLNPSTRVLIAWDLPIQMRASPTITIYNPSATNAQARDVSANVDCNSTATFTISDSRIIISTGGNASSTQGNGICVHCSADIEL